LIDQGNQPDRLFIAGDSAGGGLAVAALVALQDRGIPLPAGAILLSPWVDLTLSGESYVSQAAADPFITKFGLRRAAEHYLGGLSPCESAAPPLFADLGGLPPMLIHVGALEILLSDSIQLAAKATDAGVEVDLKVWDGLWHVFHFWAGEVPEGRTAIDEIGAFIQSLSPTHAHAQARYQLTGCGLVGPGR
jgi:monoterpene epsilon-lactone hydrolase